MKNKTNDIQERKVIEIKHKITGEVLLKVEAETLSEADLSWANLRGADLNGAEGTFTYSWGVKLKVVKEGEK